ncbi:ATP-dependent helicase/nuclease subunit A [Paenochrobactrum gallinarii]|uniref:DNA 3'-5' helicase n=1 Tax=Paenochrobactrum gallinarii TaxID=643673 RepID=A0A841M569_9HYPH|nr:double-strand break repair helicase AddA [Paenochrobactrum gallinarii]MBB6260704.1 ATP-dependent helicase/nuclease subunit A [Paenochrobactrum gallinarii]
MKKPLNIPPETILAQNKAANPFDSVWVSANAGSGKTHVLTERVIRLLLEGTDPSKILCLTYTKAAAAVMQNRVFSRLSDWAMLDDAQLAKVLEKLEGQNPSNARLNVARRLFARALETPGGLKIQTIHAFCEAILHQFPLEANIAGHFEMLDDLMQTALIAEARRQLLETAHNGGNLILAEAFTQVLDAAGEFGLQNLLDEAIWQRHGLQEFLRQLGVPSEREAALRSIFRFEPHETEATILNDQLPVLEFEEDVLDLILSIPKGAARAQDFALQLKQLSKVETLRDKQEVLTEAFLKKTDGMPKTASYVGSAAVRKLLPDFDDRFTEVSTRIYEAMERIKLLRLVRLNLAAYQIIDELLSRYQLLKRRRGLLDFDDLITRTVALLARDGAGQWVQYKLDRGIDHVLVDEAQDTSPDQWRVIRMLSDEFFSGLGQRDVRRTLFAVGDEKQSIYSFQGAVPEDFAASGQDVKKQAERAELTFEKVSLNFSFRSTPDVLSAVDEVFSRPEAFRGLGLEPAPTLHAAIRSDAPGDVEIWDMLTPHVVEEPDDWRTPVDHLAAPAIRLADQIAATIRHWLDSGAIIPGKGRKIAPRDIMVLVRKRDQFMPALSRALKNNLVPVAGADRLRLTSHIAIQDLMAIGRFVLQPADNLSLAALLKSPLFGWDDDKLFALAHDRAKGQILFEKLYQASRDDTELAKVHKKLSHWRSMADTMPVYEFYTHILSADGARRLLLARLGPEAGDIIDEFQNYALATERAGLPGLQSFLETLEAATPEIKRELDQSRDEVRIMTVHASKGLEAAIVFLVDPGNSAWTSSQAPKLIAIPMHEPDGFQGKGYLWQPNKSLETSATVEQRDELKNRSEEEYRRLLYVGMTRAEDRLIVCGYRGVRESGETWHKLVDDALSPLSDAFEHPVEGVSARRYQKTPLGDITLHEAEDTKPHSYPPLPEAFRTRMAPEKGMPRPLTPSGASALIELEDAPPIGNQSPVLEPLNNSPAFALQRGTIMHALLQHLPDVPVDERSSAAQQYLQHAGKDWSAENREKAWKSIETILNDAAFAEVFADGSKSEVSVMGMLDLNGKEQAVSGIIDRLSVSDTTVRIIDYKTNRPPALTLEEVPSAYITQLALYRELMKPLYPLHKIEAAVLFTEAPILIELPVEIMEQAIRKLERHKSEKIADE